MDTQNAFRFHNNGKPKVIFIMGATGTGKTKISIDIATRFTGEVINSDKIQVYKGLDIITNKITEHERNGVPHHMLGFMDPDVDYNAEDFCSDAILSVRCIVENGHLPIIVGGSNSYIEALVEDPKIRFRENYDFIFIWMDVSLPVLYDYVGRRVDQMVEGGLVEEVRGMFVPEADYSKGIRRAIGAPEMDRYFRAEKEIHDEASKRMLLKDAIEEIKENTCKLVTRQFGKIQRLRNELGWKMHRIDATCVFEKRGKEAEESWHKVVLKPCLEIVGKFLQKNEKDAGEKQFSTSVDYIYNTRLSVAN